jgi:hypothetical protein
MSKMKPLSLISLLICILSLQILSSCSHGSNPGLPTVVTVPPSSVGNSTVLTGGDITNKGTSAVVASGVCYGTSANPTTAAGILTSTTDSGAFVSTITGLNAATTYHVRAYATNNSGTAYGSDYSFITTNVSYDIGESYGGGVIFWVDSTGHHGLIAAGEDMATTYAWSNGSNITTGATSNNGKTNTAQIIAAQGTGNYAASVCANYRGGGYSDWYLPSLYELNLLWQQQNLFYNLANNNYWSSTESNAVNADDQEFRVSFVEQTADLKTDGFYVRAVRAF